MVLLCALRVEHRSPGECSTKRGTLSGGAVFHSWSLTGRPVSNDAGRRGRGAKTYLAIGDSFVRVRSCGTLQL